MPKLFRIAAKVAAVIVGLLLLLATVVSAEVALSGVQHNNTEVIAENTLPKENPHMKRVEITIKNFPAAGQTSTITTKPLDAKAAESVKAEAQSLGHTATVR